MKLFAYTAATTLSFLFAIAASAGEVVERSYTIKDVLEVHAGSGIRLELTQGDTESLTLKAPAIMLEKIHVDITNQKLSLRVDSDLSDIFNWFRKDEIVFTLVVKNLHLLDLSGGVEANVGKLTLEKLAIKNSGGTESQFANLQVNDVSIDVSGGAEVRVGVMNSERVSVNLSGGAEFVVESSGATNLLKIDAGGGSKCRAEKLASVAAEVLAGGGSDVELRVAKTLKVSAGGASSVNYYGKPVVNSNVGGAGNVTGNN